jgi:hypothetical protein
LVRYGYHDVAGFAFCTLHRGNSIRQADFVSVANVMIPRFLGAPCSRQRRSEDGSFWHVAEIVVRISNASPTGWMIIWMDAFLNSIRFSRRALGAPPPDSVYSGAGECRAPALGLQKQVHCLRCLM